MASPWTNTAGQRQAAEKDRIARREQIEKKLGKGVATFSLGNDMRTQAIVDAIDNNTAALLLVLDALEKR
jgi:hypothetical protein